MGGKNRAVGHREVGTFTYTGGDRRGDEWVRVYFMVLLKAVCAFQSNTHKL